MTDDEIDALVERLTKPHVTQPAELQKYDYLIRGSQGWVIGQQVTVLGDTPTAVVRRLGLAGWNLAQQIKDANLELAARKRAKRSVLERISDGH